MYSIIDLVLEREKKMVAPLSFVGMAFTLILTLFLPIIIWIFFATKDASISKPILFGALGFVVSQVIIRIPLIQIAGTFESFVDFSSNYKYLFLLILALSAGLFETSARLIVLKGLARKSLDYKISFWAGYGHGIGEAVILIGLTYINNIVIAGLINLNLLPALEQMEGIKEVFLSTPSHMFFAAGIERVLVVFAHIAMTLILSSFILRKKSLLGFFLVVIFHTVLDFSVIVLNDYFQNIWISLGLLAIFALISILYILKTRPSKEVLEKS